MSSYQWQVYYDTTTNTIHSKVQQLVFYVDASDPWPLAVAEVTKLKYGCIARIYASDMQMKFPSTKKAKAWVLAIVTLES